MEELFRFSITRPAQRTDAATLPLETKDNLTLLQRDLRVIATDEATRRRWQPLQERALRFIKDHEGWLLAFDNQGDVRVLRKLLIDLQADLQKTPPTEWQTLIQTAANTLSAAAGKIGPLRNDLADLFLALLLVRTLGPPKIDKLIRAQPPPFALAEVLHDRPSLNEVADLLRMVDLVLTPFPSLAGKKPVDVQATLTAVLTRVRAAMTKTLVLPPGIFSEFEKPVHAVGITDLLVVKQHIHHYELGEIARIENILKGETRDHSQKHTLSNERDTFFQTDKETVTEQELTSTDRVSIKSEIENTLKEDTKIDAGVHFQYDGKPYKFSTDLTVAYDRSSSESKKFASEIAKEVTQKASKKVTERIQQSVTTKVIETFEELEDQKFTNESGPHVSGVYQWVQKVYLAQVFNYGRHMLFDIMVPEPAASLLKLDNDRTKNQKVPVPPDPLVTENKPLRPEDLKDSETAGNWIAKFQVTGVEPPPRPKTFVKSIAADRPNANTDIKVADAIKLDNGYAADWLSVSVAFRSFKKDDGGEIATVTINVGQRQFTFAREKATGEGMILAGEVSDVQGRVANLNLNTVPEAQRRMVGEEGSVAFSVFCQRVDEMTVDIEIVCQPTNELFARWQLQTYERIVARWQKLQADYEDKLAAIQFQKGTMGLLGAADPETNRQIERTELKRSCITILDNDNATVSGQSPNVAVADYPPGIEFLGPPGTTPPLQLPEPDLQRAEDLGANVRWFEQAFEWDKIGYVFYPYFWGRRTEWLDRLKVKNDDPLFENFLRAGYARVVVPVRNGFEDAVNFFMLTGIPWFGGGLPKIWEEGTNPLYLSIVEEIKEQTGAPGKETPSDEPPWFIRLPTKLIKLRKDDARPRWTLDPKDPKHEPPNDAWTWKEDAPDP